MCTRFVLGKLLDDKFLGNLEQPVIQGDHLSDMVQAYVHEIGFGESSILYRRARDI